MNNLKDKLAHKKWCLCNEPYNNNKVCGVTHTTLVDRLHRVVDTPVIHVLSTLRAMSS